MKELSIDEIKEIELQILDYIDSVCKENNLHYYLSGGTLLGAIRHKGFIPWDDDIDINMPRKDYEKLLLIINESDNKYKALSYKYETDYYYPFAKIIDSSTMVTENNTVKSSKMGIWVDIFPIDNLPNDTKLRKRIQEKCWVYRQIWGHALVWKGHLSNRGLVYKIGCLICYLYGWKRSIKQLERVATLIHEETKYVGKLIDCNHKYDTMLADWFSPSVDKTFEGRMCPVPNGYDEYLTLAYGDYMKLPPEDKRVSGHSFVAYRKDDEAAFNI